MAHPFESVVFIPEEAQFVQNTMFAFSQNQAVGNTSDAGSVAPITKSERDKALSILAKVRSQVADPAKNPIVFTQDEALLMQYLYLKLIQTHGKPQGDLDWTYYIRFNDITMQLVVNVINKIGGRLDNFPSDTYPVSFNPFPRL